MLLESSRDVIAGRDPAIQHQSNASPCSWMPGSSPGMTMRGRNSHSLRVFRTAPAGNRGTGSCFPGFDPGPIYWCFRSRHPPKGPGSAAGERPRFCHPALDAGSSVTRGFPDFGWMPGQACARAPACAARYRATILCCVTATVAHARHCETPVQRLRREALLDPFLREGFNDSLEGWLWSKSRARRVDGAAEHGFCRR